MRLCRWCCVVLGLVAGCRHSTRSDSAPSATATAPREAAVASLSLATESQAAGLSVRSGIWRAGALGTWGVTDLELDLTRTRLEIALGKGGAELASLLPAGGLAVVNGGYFEADFRPSTWLKNAGLELAPRSDTSKGGVLALAPGSLYVGPFNGLHFEPELAVQSFPLLVEPDHRPGIHRDDGRRAARTLACLIEERLHLIVISAPRGEGPTLFEAAGLLGAASPEGFGCRVALNLDGGPSSGVWFGAGIAARQRPPLAKVGYAIAILRRP
jgi:hypothetical protein